jgi:tight adherence protein B
MTPILLTFGAVLLIIMGAYWFFVTRPEAEAQFKIRRRLRRERIAEKATPTMVRGEQPLSTIPAFDAALGRTRAFGDGLQSLIARSGMRTTVGALLLMTAFVTVAVFEALFLLQVPWVLAIILGVTAGSVPYIAVRYKASKRMQRFEELFPEAIGLIIRSLRAGHAFTTGLAMVAEEMADPVGPEFRTLYDEQNFGMPLEDALKRMAGRVQLIDVKFFVTAVLTQREAGGNLAEVLDNLTAVVRDRFKVKRQVRVVTAHARLSGTILMVLPLLCTFAMLLVAPTHMRVLWTDPSGIRMLTVAVVLQIIGVLIIRRIIRIEY